MAKLFFFILLICLSCAPHLLTSATTAIATNTRRILHQPLFPQDSPPAPPPSTQPPAPNIPFSTSTPNQQPFFSDYPPPPPPPSSSSSPSSIASFPANISSLNLPGSPKSKPTSSKLIATAVAVVSAAVVVLTIVIFLHVRKRRRQDFTDEKTYRSDNNSSRSVNVVVNGGTGASTGIPKLQRPSQTSAEFLYLGTLVNAHNGLDPPVAPIARSNGSSGISDISNPRKLDSPELHPLPPLSGGFRQNYSKAESNHGGDEEDEEFYSPRGSVSGHDSSIGTESTSMRVFAAVEVKNFEGISCSSSSSYSSSTSGSPVRSVSLSISPPGSLSPISSRPKSPELAIICSVPLPYSSSPERNLTHGTNSNSSDLSDSSPRSSNVSNQTSHSPERINCSLQQPSSVSMAPSSSQLPHHAPLVVAELPIPPPPPPTLPVVAEPAYVPPPPPVVVEAEPAYVPPPPPVVVEAEPAYVQPPPPIVAEVIPVVADAKPAHVPPPPLAVVEAESLYVPPSHPIVAEAELPYVTPPPPIVAEAEPPYITPPHPVVADAEPPYVPPPPHVCFEHPIVSPPPPVCSEPPIVSPPPLATPIGDESHTLPPPPHVVIELPTLPPPPHVVIELPTLSPPPPVVAESATLPPPLPPVVAETPTPPPPPIVSPPLPVIAETPAPPPPPIVTPPPLATPIGDESPTLPPPPHVIIESPTLPPPPPVVAESATLPPPLSPVVAETPTPPPPPPAPTVVAEPPTLPPSPPTPVVAEQPTPPIVDELPTLPPAAPPVVAEPPTLPPPPRRKHWEIPATPLTLAPPPTPPPPPPRKHWEIPKTPTPLAREPLSHPPILITPSRPILLQTPAPISPLDLSSPSETAETNEDTPKLKLKPLHWDKVRASSDRGTVWDQLKSSSFKLNEEMIETLFVVKTPAPNPMETTRRSVLPSPNQENRVLDPKKSQNISILLRAINVTIEEVCEALLEGNADTLGTELLESLLKMAPTKEEERKLKEYKDDSPIKLGPAERFLKSLLEIPFAFKRMDVMLYVSNFDSEIEYLKKSCETLETACEELRSSRMFLKLLEAVLKTGNRMNVGTNRGDAHAFKLDTLLKLVDVKGADGKTTLLHFVVQEIIRSEGSRLSGSAENQETNSQDDARCRKLGLQIVSGISSELKNVKKAASMDSEVLNGDVLKLTKGLSNIAEVVRLNEDNCHDENTRRFSESMNKFMKTAEEEIIRIQAQESVALSLVKEITEYFHGNSAKEEAHPFRIFMVVRDFLVTLDRVCKEVGMINERTIVSSAHKFPVPVNPTLPPPVFNGFTVRRQYSSSSDDDS